MDYLVGLPAAGWDSRLLTSIAYTAYCIICIRLLRCDFFMALLSLLYILSLSLSLSPFHRAGSRVQRLLVRPSVRCIFLARVAARSRTACLTVFCSPRCLPMVTSVLLTLSEAVYLK